MSTDPSPSSSRRCLGPCSSWPQRCITIFVPFLMPSPLSLCFLKDTSDWVRAHPDLVCPHLKEVQVKWALFPNQGLCR
jgi:hypothetical protein